MKSDDIFTSPNIAKSDLFCLAFSVVCVVLQKNYMKRLLAQRRSFWYAKHVCRCCISLFDIWKVMTFLYLEIWQKMTYFSLYFQLCALYCNRNYMKRLPSHRGSFNMQNMSVDSVFSYLTYEKWWHFYICQYGKKWLILPCIFSCVCCTATEIIWKDCSHREEAFDMQKMCVDCVFAYLTYEEWWHFYIS